MRPRRARAAVLATAVFALTLAGCSAGGGHRSGAQQPATASCPAPGKPASGAHLLPDLTLPCLGHDRQVALRRLTGTPTVLTVWASWCEPCREELPALQRFAAAAGSSVRVLGVDTADDASTARSYLQARDAHFPSVSDRGHKTLTALGYPGPPVSVFVRADGSVATVHPGPVTYAQLRRLAATALHTHLADAGR